MGELQSPAQSCWPQRPPLLCVGQCGIGRQSCVFGEKTYFKPSQYIN
jgi:hypothetical protein